MEITIRCKDQYGRRVAHPVCNNAKIFADIARTKTLTFDTLRAINMLGVDIVVLGDVTFTMPGCTDQMTGGEKAASSLRQICNLNLNG